MLPLTVRRGHVRAVSGLHYNRLRGRSLAWVRNSRPREPEADDTSQPLWLAGVPPLPIECAPWLETVFGQEACPRLGQPLPTWDIRHRQEYCSESRASEEPGLDHRWGQPPAILCHAASIRLVNRLHSKSYRSPPYHLGLNLACIVQRFLHGGATPHHGASHRWCQRVVLSPFTAAEPVCPCIALWLWSGWIVRRGWIFRQRKIP
jgi:hypothetical protein